MRMRGYGATSTMGRLATIFVPFGVVALFNAGGVTAVLFTLGKYGIGFYLARTGVTSTYGAAGSLVLVLVWVYFSSLIFLLGAEFTRVHSRRYREGRAPASPGAVRVATIQVPLEPPTPAAAKGP